jgi:2-keto-4-pentenoate hydratase
MEIGTRRPDVERAYRSLAAAWSGPGTVDPVRGQIADADAAYAVQRALIADRVRAGARVTGRKIGLTSPAVQAQLGVDRPDFGVLLDEMDRTGAAVIDVAGLRRPRVEAEVAFVLATDIDDPDADAHSVRDAVAHCRPALEIVDSRITDWDITLVDTVADNASSGLYVLGPARVPLRSFEPRACTMTMTADGIEVSTGSGDQCLGDPLAALAWLARTALRLGDPLRAGQVVLSGALGPMVPVAPGLRVDARITGLGDVHAAFGAG